MFLLDLDKTDVDTADNEGQTPLQYAAMKGDCATAEVLIKAGADVQCGNKRGYCPKHWAAKFNRAPPLRRLSHFGWGHVCGLGTPACINEVAHSATAPETKYKPHFLSGTKKSNWVEHCIGHDDVLRLVLQANAGTRTAEGFSVLHLAAMGGHAHVFPLLMERGADDIHAVDSDGMTPIVYAAQYYHWEMVQLLVDRGADIHLADKQYGRTALHWAAEGGHLAVVLLLVDRGADIHPADTACGRTALHYAAAGGHREVVQLLVDCSADIHCALPHGSSPLHFAAVVGCCDHALL